MENYYTELYKHVQDKYIVVSRFGHSHTPVLARDVASRISSIVDGVNDNFYHSYAVFDGPPESGRGKNEDVGAVVGAYLDLDFGETGRYAGSKNPSQSLDETLALLAEWGLPEPSAVVFSGNGHHAEWWLDSPLFIKTDADRERAASFLKGFNAYAIQRGAQSGLKMDNMGDLARVKRCVGSRNWKNPQDPKLVEVVRFSKLRYPLAKLSAFQPIAAPAKSETSRQPPQRRTNSKLPSWELIAANCPFAKFCVENAATLPEPYWYAILGIVARCENGEEWAHAISKAYPGYSKAETDRKLAHALSAAGPATYSHIRSLGFTAFESNIVAQNARSPIQFGYSSQPLIDLMNEFVYDADSERFFSLRTLVAHSQKGFGLAQAHRVQNPVAAFVGSPLAIKVARTDFLPGDPRLVTTGDGLVLNVYRDSPLKPEPGNCDTILAHFQYLFPDEKERTYALDYLAHMVQRPGDKIGTALLIFGPQGVGKNVFVNWQREIVGASNVRVISADAILNRFRADRVNIQLLVLNEVMGVNRAAANTMKEMITEESVRVEEKGTPSFEARTPRAHILLTNDPAALAIEAGDRRYAVLSTAVRRPDQSYFDHLFERSPHELAAFADYLGKRDLSGFNPHASAPDTAAKEVMRTLTLSGLEADIDTGIKDGIGCFQRDLVSVRDVQNTVLAIGGNYRTPIPQSVSRVLKMLGAESLPQQRFEGGERLRLWAVRNQDQWLKADPKQIKDHYAKPIAFSSAFSGIAA